MSRRSSFNEDASINLTPMIDVVFLLVIFFMVGSHFGDASGGVDVTVPGVGELRAMTRTPDERVVEVTPSGSVLLDRNVVSDQQLADQLRFAHQQFPDVRVAVRGDSGASWPRVAQVLQVIRSTGVKQMVLAEKAVQR